jgi:hypothetical protein
MFVGVLFHGCKNGEDDIYMWRRLRGAYRSLSLPAMTDEPLPTKELWDVTDYCHNRKKQLITV